MPIPSVYLLQYSDIGNNFLFTLIRVSVLYSSFRGYPLMGKVISLPKGYKGIVAQETVKPMTEGAERNIHVMHTFTSFTYWNWDKPPSLNDALLSALDWIDISEVVIIDYTLQSFK
jgi:hypothetical protein